MLDKAIESGKEHREPYRRSKRFDRSCRNHGGCGYCEDNRTAKVRAQAAAAELQIKEFWLVGWRSPKTTKAPLLGGFQRLQVLRYIWFSAAW